MGLGKSYTDQDGNQGTLLHMLLSKSPGYADFMSKARGTPGYSVADPQAIRNIRADASSDPATKAALRAGEEVGGGLVSLQEGGGLGSAFSQGFQQGTLDPMVSTPIPPTADPYGSAAGLSNLMMPNVYTDVNSYNQGTPVGPPVDTQMLQTAQNFANPSVFSYNGVNQGGGGLSGMMPSGAPGSMNPMAGMQNQVFNQGQQGMGQQQLPQQQIMPAQPYTMGT